MQGPTVAATAMLETAMKHFSAAGAPNLRRITVQLAR